MKAFLDKLYPLGVRLDGYVNILELAENDPEVLCLLKADCGGKV